MERPTKDKVLTEKENYIKELISAGDKRYINTFNLIFNYYRLDYLRNKSNYFLVFKAIYIEKVKLPNWELADYCHVCKSTLYDYRNKIIDFFYSCLNNNITMEEIAITKG